MKTVPQKLIDALCWYRSPGNVHELQHVIECAVIPASDGIIHFDSTLKSSHVATTSSTWPGHPLDEAGGQHCVIARKKGAARPLGLKPDTVPSKLKKPRIQRPTLSLSLPQSPATARKRTGAVRKAATSVPIYRIAI
jgi:transcriptional regulator of acetoin/glycerol metabolism